MKDIILKAQKRDLSMKTKELRLQKMVPAIVYGGEKDNQAIQIDASDLLRTYRNAGESHIITLDVDGAKTDVLIHDYQKHHITGDFTHMDFYAVTMGQTLTTMIKLEATGASPAEKDGAIIEEQIKELEVTVLPKNLVDSFTYDLSALKEFGDVIRVGDLGIDKEKYDYDLEDTAIVAVASEPRKEEVADEAPEFEEAEVVGEGETAETTEEEK